MLSLSLTRKRLLVRFLHLWEPLLDGVGLLVLFGFFLNFVPVDLLRSGPPTGGDTGSHYWTLHGLFYHGLPNGGVRVWNPGNHGGEPRLLHYFPLPFLIMAGIGQFIPLGTAFNIGAVLATALFPFCVYIALRGLGLRFPAPLLGAATAHFAHYNESYSMWGGNTLSTLAGQFAHSYALDFLLLGIGALGWEIRRSYRIPIWSPLLFQCVFLCHGYPALGIPFILFSFLLFFRHGALSRRLFMTATTGVFSVLLSLWFLLPMQLNKRWQTKHDLHWFSDKLLAEVFPPAFGMPMVLLLATLGAAALYYLLRLVTVAKLLATAGLIAATTLVVWLGYDLIVGPRTSLTGGSGRALWRLVLLGETVGAGPLYYEVLLGMLARLFAPKYFALYAAFVLTLLLILSQLLLQRSRGAARSLTMHVSFWLVPAVWYVYLYYLLPLVELIDIRAVPQIHLFAMILVGVSVGLVLRSVSRLWSFLLTLPLLALVLYGVQREVKNFGGWLQWNASGWVAKDLYPVVMGLSQAIRGSFSDPRVIYELSDKAQPAGTIRLWEMLPYFAGRATLESVYLEATLLSGEAVYLQGEISKFPSCPLPQYACARYNIPNAVPRLKLMGVGALILANHEPIVQARESDAFREKGRFGPWTLFELREQPPLVEVFRRRPILSVDEGWRESFYNWFTNYDGVKPFLISEEKLAPKIRASLLDPSEHAARVWSGGEECSPSVTVDFNRITLRTDCPGKAHFLKFNYHPSWRTNTGDELFIVSPAFMGIIPSREEVTLDFGYLPSWKFANAVSLTSYGVLCLMAVVFRRCEPQ